MRAYERSCQQYAAVALAEFGNLHAGNVVRFGLRPLEFAAWQERNDGGGVASRHTHRRQ